MWGCSESWTCSAYVMYEREGGLLSKVGQTSYMKFPSSAIVLELCQFLKIKNREL